MGSVSVIIVAAGQGKRAGIQKQWVTIGSKPLIAYSLETFEKHPLVQAIYLGVDKDHLRTGEEALARWAPGKGRRTYPGGERRQDTVWEGLKLLDEECTLVGIHDGARPLASPNFIRRVIQKARKKGAAIPVLPLKDTVKEVEKDQVVRTLQRGRLRAAQTPQFFKRGIIIGAYEKALREGQEATDDAALVEAMGYPLWWVEGEETNFKVTCPQDLERVRAMLESPIKVGFGYDVHPFVKGRRLMLGGIEISNEKGLQGHSDADVLCHAVVDALLGAAGMGDIGTHFPDSDPRYKDSSSLEFLRDAARLLQRGDWEIVHIDATLVLEKPRIAPYKKEMEQRIAQALNIPTHRINLKATTTEGLGFTGRGEGIAAYAIATLKKRYIQNW